MELHMPKDLDRAPITPEAAAPSADVLQMTGEVSRGRKVARKMGNIAFESAAMFAGAAVTYGALKSGYLDSTPFAVHGSLANQLSFSMGLGMPAGRMVYNRTRAFARSKK